MPLFSKAPPALQGPSGSEDGAASGRLRSGVGFFWWSSEGFAKKQLTWISLRIGSLVSENDQVNPGQPWWVVEKKLFWDVLGLLCSRRLDRGYWGIIPKRWGNSMGNQVTSYSHWDIQSDRASLFLLRWSWHILNYFNIKYGGFHKWGYPKMDGL